MLYKNKKTGDLYEVICDNVIEANNNPTNQKIVVYKHVKTSQLYWRTRNEFNEKFELNNEDNTSITSELPYQNDYYIGAPGGTDKLSISSMPGTCLDGIIGTEWFKQKRDDALDRFNDAILSNVSPAIIEKRYHSLLRIQKQLQVAEDVTIIPKLVRKWTQES